MKWTILIYLLFISAIGSAQVWEYPYSTIDVVNQKTASESNAIKVWVIDSSENLIMKTYYEYDNRGNRVKEVNPDNNDTISINYDEFGYEIKWHSSLRGSSEEIYLRNEKGWIMKHLTLEDNDTSVTVYERDSISNITRFSNEKKIVKEFFYDTKNRLIKVIEYLNFGTTNISATKTYEYNKDTISIKICSYNSSGIKNSWPCDEKIGIMNDHNDLKELTQISFYEDEKPSKVYTKFNYNSSNQLINLIVQESNGNSEIRFYYDTSGHNRLTEMYNDGILNRTVESKLIE